MKCQSMFPFRRNGPKKRGKGGGGGGGGGRRHHDNGGGGRRIPGSAAELLPMMQPTTKALAQMLAGNTKMSGQLVHARSVLAQANRMVEDRLPDRLSPKAREEFFEQLAVLKLTIADAEEDGLVPEAEPAPRPTPPMDADRLREVALRLATADPAPQVPLAPLRGEGNDDGPNPADVPSGYTLSRSRSTSDETAAPSEASGTGPRRERLRLKPVQRPASGSDA